LPEVAKLFPQHQRLGFRPLSLGVHPFETVSALPISSRLFGIRHILALEKCAEARFSIMNLNPPYGFSHRADFCGTLHKYFRQTTLTKDVLCQGGLFKCFQKNRHYAVKNPLKAIQLLIFKSFVI